MSPATDYPKIVGRVIRALRNQLGFSQVVMAMRCGVDQSSWSRMEARGTCITVENLRRFSSKIGMPAGYMLTVADQVAGDAEAKGIAVRFDALKHPFVQDDVVVSVAEIDKLVAARLKASGG